MIGRIKSIQNLYGRDYYLRNYGTGDHAIKINSINPDKSIIVGSFQTADTTAYETDGVVYGPEILSLDSTTLNIRVNSDGGSQYLNFNIIEFDSDVLILKEYVAPTTATGLRPTYGIADYNFQYDYTDFDKSRMFIYPIHQAHYSKDREFQIMDVGDNYGATIIYKSNRLGGAFSQFIVFNP